LEAGDLLGADLRLIEASKLQLDESTLTGESLPVDKQVAPVRAEAPLAERASMVYQGTAVTRGAGEGVVVGTGLHTELGRIATLTGETKAQETPLERRLDQLGQRLVWVTLAIATVVLAAGVLRGKNVLLMIETAIALAVATIPEGLPIVATLALARGMLRMAKRNALITRLSAVETLGATDIICTDKTGTLTENRMAVRRLALAEETDGGLAHFARKVHLRHHRLGKPDLVPGDPSVRLRQVTKHGKGGGEERHLHPFLVPRGRHLSSPDLPDAAIEAVPHRRSQ